mgnify:CR=1 FL=1
MRELKLGKYTHFKSKEKIYEVLGVSLHTETEEELVIYKALYESKDFPYGQIWARPKESFLAKVPIGKDNPTGQIYRFEYVDET